MNTLILWYDLTVTWTETSEVYVTIKYDNLLECLWSAQALESQDFTGLLDFGCSLAHTMGVIL